MYVYLALTFVSPSTYKQHDTPQLPPQIFPLYIMRVLYLSPLLDLVQSLQCRSLGRLLYPKSIRWRGSVFTQMPKLLTPFYNQPRSHQQRLRRQYTPLECSKFERRQPVDPAADDFARELWLRCGHDGILGQDWNNVNAGEDVRVEEGDDGFRCFTLSMS